MIDLHIHTTNSDGTDSVSVVLEKANERNIKLISITDHNSVNAYKELNESRRLYNGEIISGVEISTSYKGQNIEILGYGIDTDYIASYLEKAFSRNSDYQNTLFNTLYNAYKEIGVRMDVTEYDPTIDKFARPVLCKDIISHPENSKFFLDADNMSDIGKFYRNEMYNPDSPLYIDFSFTMPDINSVLDAIHNSGGLAFLAHLYVYNERVYKELNELAEYDFDGFECMYPSFTKEQTNQLIKFCKENKFYISGGTDYHGKRRPGINLGVGNGNMQVEYDYISDWIQLINKI